MYENMLVGLVLAQAFQVLFLSAKLNSERRLRAEQISAWMAYGESIAAIFAVGYWPFQEPITPPTEPPKADEAAA